MVSLLPCQLQFFPPEFLSHTTARVLYYTHTHKSQCLMTFPLKIPKQPTGYVIQTSQFSPVSWFLHSLSHSLPPTHSPTHFAHTKHLRDPQCAVLYSTPNFISILHIQFPVYKLLLPTPLFLLDSHNTPLTV